MAKFAIVMPVNGTISLQAAEIVEADYIEYDRTMGVTLLKSGNVCENKIVAIIPAGRVVYKVAEPEPESKGNSIEFPYIDKSERANAEKEWEPSFIDVIANRNSVISALSKQSKEKTDFIEELKQSLAAQKEMIAAKTATIESLENEKNGLMFDVKSICDERDTYKNQVEALKARLNESEEKVKSFGEKLYEAFKAVLKEVK